MFHQAERNYFQVQLDAIGQNTMSYSQFVEFLRQMQARVQMGLFDWVLELGVRMCSYRNACLERGLVGWGLCWPVERFLLLQSQVTQARLPPFSAQ